MATLKDRFGRRIDYLRISVTDRCNYRCFYCMPEVGATLEERSEFLTYEDLTRHAGTDLIPVQPSAGA